MEDKSLLPKTTEALPKKQKAPLEIALATLPKGLKKANEAQTSLHELGLTVAKAMQGATIRSMRSPESDMLMLTSVTFLVNRASKTNETFKPIPEELALSLAIDLLEVMEFDTIDDIILMFKMARQGKLRISSMKKKKSFYEMVLQDYVPAYLDEKAKERERQYYEKRRKETKVAEPTTEEAKENRRKFQEKIRALRLSVENDNKGKKINPKGVLINSGKDTPVESQTALTTQIIEQAKRMNLNELKERIAEWNKYNDKRAYVYLYQNELTFRINANEAH